MTMIEQIEMLKAMMRKKDEAIVALYGALIDNFCHEDPRPFLKDDPNRCETCSCMPARMSAVEALSLTPALAKLESDAARVTELEQVIVKKDEALQAMLDAHPLGMLIWNIGKCRICGTATASGMIDCCIDCADKAARNALSLTPAALAEVEEDARVGRAVKGWANTAMPPSDFSKAGAAGYGVAICQVLRVITKAREESR